MLKDMKRQLDEIAKKLKDAKKVAVLTGAGVSAESGVPTFRGQGGLWRNKDPMKLASIEGFLKNPKEVWEFYNWRRELISKVNFNPAHKAIAELEEKKDDFLLITQNVDGLHRLAGSKKIIEIHGNIWKVRCTECKQEFLDKRPNLGVLPKCEKCGGLLRPGVVFFGESLDPILLDKSIEFLKSCDFMMVVGTSSVVQPAASFSMVAKEAGAIVVEINLEKTPYTNYMDYSIQGKAGEILPLIVERV